MSQTKVGGLAGVGGVGPPALAAMSMGLVMGHRPGWGGGGGRGLLIMINEV